MNIQTRMVIWLTEQLNVLADRIDEMNRRNRAKAANLRARREVDLGDLWVE
jgi:hypothetical protein